MPFQSESQRRKFYVMVDRGEISQETVEEWEDHTKEEDLPNKISKAAYKLQGRMDFQGLPISVENRKNSKRHWKDPHSGEKGFTKMKFPYGYIRGTLGLDGDAVDVFVGPERDSTKVFVITQNKAPEFKDVDEQKVMLGFESKTKAKQAYLDHYDSSKFFRDMKELTIEEFKEKLSNKKGKLIKSNNFDRINKESSINFRERNMSESVKILKGMQTKLKFQKALTGAVAAGLTKRNRLAQEYNNKAKQEAAPTLGISYTRPAWEPPVVPVRKVEQPESPVRKAEVGTDCISCGYVRKSTTTDCPICSAASFGEALPYWRR